MADGKPLGDIIKDSPVVFFLGAIVTGFLAGVAAYKGILEIMLGKGVKRMRVPRGRNVANWLRYRDIKGANALRDPVRGSLNCKVKRATATTSSAATTSATAATTSATTTSSSAT